jgi:hypothetical protein
VLAHVHDFLLRVLSTRLVVVLGQIVEQIAVVSNFGRILKLSDRFIEIWFL